MRVLHVVGARPNFMKIAPIMREMRKFPETFHQTLVHTGQHYDENMSKVFFDQLGLPKPDIDLGIGSASQARQTGEIMVAFERIIQDYQPDWVIVVGDVNSTLACTLVCSKLGVKVAHVEAGLRSFDRTMPEEINRIVTDQLADRLFTPSRDADENLIKEGISGKKIYFVGNVMIDSLVNLLPKAEGCPIMDRFELPIEAANGMDRPNFKKYILVTLHRPANVDEPDKLKEILGALEGIGKDIAVIFPIHPRTKKKIAEFDLTANPSTIQFTDPLGYLEFLCLMKNAALVITDSGGVQEETTYLKVPCLTIRPNTERPITVSLGTNRLVPCDTENILKEAQKSLRSTRVSGDIPELWDGESASRIVRVMKTV